MLALPPAILELLDLKAGNTVAVKVAGQRLVIEPKPRPRYTLDELLKGYKRPRRQSKEDRVWLTGASSGKELI